jgi:AraC-like DNA-binding protein
MTVAEVSPLGDVLSHVRMSGIFYCPSVLTEPWGLEIPPMEHCLWFHVVSSGVATLRVGDGPAITGVPGDLVLVPHGTGHLAHGVEPATARPVLDLPHEEVNERYAVLHHGGGGALTEVVCGGVRFDHPAARHLVAALPPVIHLAGARLPRGDWLRATLDLLADEARSVRPGSEAVVSRLCDIVVIQAIRAWIETDPAARSGWLGALRDDPIGAAIARIHAEPSAPWTVEGLAAEVAMSRSAFSARFTELVGESVMKYVTRWRAYRALDLLEAGDTTVARVAAMVGYDSEASFSRAFKRVVGVSPGSVSRRG